MTVNELRIGNWVEFQAANGDWYPRSFEITDYRDFEDENTSYRPILLTEEVLLKLEFTKMDGEWYLYPCFEVQIIAYTDGKYTGLMFYTRTIHTDFTPIYVSNKIDFLHQLQNLYFALTGQELDYTP